METAFFVKSFLNLMISREKKMNALYFHSFCFRQRATELFHRQMHKHGPIWLLCFEYYANKKQKSMKILLFFVKTFRNQVISKGKKVSAFHFTYFLSGNAQRAKDRFNCSFFSNFVTYIKREHLRSRCGSLLVIEFVTLNFNGR